MDSFVASAASVNLGLVHPTSSPLAVSAAARGPRGAKPQPPYERALTENRFPVSGLGAPDDTGGNTPQIINDREQKAIPTPPGSQARTTIPSGPDTLRGRRSRSGSVLQD